MLYVVVSRRINANLTLSAVKDQLTSYRRRHPMVTMGLSNAYTQYEANSAGISNTPTPQKKRIYYPVYASQSYATKKQKISRLPKRKLYSSDTTNTRTSSLPSLKLAKTTIRTLLQMRTTFPKHSLTLLCSYVAALPWGVHRSAPPHHRIMTYIVTMTPRVLPQVLVAPGY